MKLKNTNSVGSQSQGPQSWHWFWVLYNARTQTWDWTYGPGRSAREGEAGPELSHLASPSFANSSATISMCSQAHLSGRCGCGCCRWESEQEANPELRFGHHSLLIHHLLRTPTRLGGAKVAVTERVSSRPYLSSLVCPPPSLCTTWLGGTEVVAKRATLGSRLALRSLARPLLFYALLAHLHGGGHGWERERESGSDSELKPGLPHLT